MRLVTPISFRRPPRRSLSSSVLIRDRVVVREKQADWKTVAIYPPVW